MFYLETTYDEKEKLWHGPDTQLLTDPSISIGETLFEALKEVPEKINQICHDDDTTSNNAEALLLSIRLAQYFKGEGLTHEDVVGIIARNSTKVAYLLYACFFNATPFHTVNPHLESSVIADLFATTKPKIIFCDGCDYEQIRESTKDWNPKVYTIIEHIENVPTIEELLKATNSENFYQPTKLVNGPDQTMAILCSSGTTGYFKAVTQTNSQLLQISPTSGTKDIIYATGSYDWISSVKSLLVSTVSKATRIVCGQTFTPELFVEIVRKYRVTCSSISHWQMGVIFTHPLATAENLSSLQFFVFGGGWISLSFIQTAQRILKETLFLFVYGCSEIDIASICINPDRDNLVGFLTPGKCVRIVNELGQNLGPNQIGEILIKSSLNWNGYYNNEKQTALSYDENGWFYIGDIGYFDSDNKLYIVDRKKDMLRYRSMDFAPNDIEKIIIEMPDVVDVCVVGINERNFGDEAGALVMKKPGSLLTDKEVVNYVARRITADYKQLRAGVQFVDKLPINHNGKLLRRVAKEMFRTQQLPKASL